ncbi:MAG TPA: YqgE/AlgH family protein [Chthoniobacterales bacterium]
MRHLEKANLAGQLLVAHPNLRDPNFRRSVLFISAHDAKAGASGVILNRPLDKTVSDLTDEDGLDALADVAVYAGGPVATNEVMFAAFDWSKDAGLTMNQNALPGSIASFVEENSNSIRAFVGYAGWGAGQLERELAQNAWLLHQPAQAELTPERLPKLWFEIMRGLGPWFKMLAAAPDDPSLN